MMRFPSLNDRESKTVATIQIQQLSKKYGAVVALDDVNLEVEDGEFLTILGPSGSGKTTMLLTIAGFEFPDRGTIRIDSKDITNMPAYKRKIGLTFQSYALFPHMSVEDNVSYPLRIRRVDKGERRVLVNRALEMVQLIGTERRRPHELSGGQQQRVALARALVFKPDILLLDEPMAALDRQLRQSVQVELRELQRSLKVTTVAVTHDQEEALTMSDRILVLSQGRVQQHGAPNEVYRCPCNKFVASFLGTANLIEGTVQAAGNGHALLHDASGLLLPIGATHLGRRVVVMLRPEQVRILPATTDGGVPGLIRTAVYVGTGTRYRIETATDVVLEASESGKTRYAVGDRVRLDWEPDDVWILPGANEAGMSFC